MSNITKKKTLDIEGITITSRVCDGYVNASQLCQAGKRLFSTYFRRKRTKEFLKALEVMVQICTVELIKYMKGGNGERHIWVHPQVAINIAQWISPKFDLMVSRWVYELLLCGDVKLGEERSYEELDAKLKEANTMIENLNEQITNMTFEYKKLRKAHRAILKHKSLHYFKKGKCFYVISNTKEKEDRIKIGISCDINTRLKTHRTAIPFLKLHYLVFLNQNKLLEDNMKQHYKNNLDPNNHEFISGVSVKSVINKTKDCINFLNVQNTEVTYDELLRYNKDTNSEDQNEEIYEKEFKENKQVLVEEKPLIPSFIKRCPGKFHTSEEERMLESTNFHKNRSTRDGMATYCKECASKTRYKNENHLERKNLTYDKTQFKYCPGPGHNCSEDRIIALVDFHNNKASKDSKSSYCKECEGIKRYGAKRKRRILINKEKPKDINLDTHKWCGKCNNVLLHNQFHVNNTSSDGLQSYCKTCAKKARC